jgi:hypothetical protein
MAATGEFGVIFIDAVIVQDRIRAKPRTTSEHNRLIKSIQRRGLMSPIVIDRDNKLIAGEGRIMACRALGWTHIPFQYADELTFRQRRLMEAEENNAREDLFWEDNHNNYMTLIEGIREENPNATVQDMADELNLEVSSVHKHLTYDSLKHIPAVQETAKESGFGAGYRAAVRVQEREQADFLNRTIHTIEPFNDTHQSPIRIADFRDWAPTYTGQPFNLIHCDFPFGINAHQHAGQNSSLRVDYTDSEDIYWELIHALVLNLNRLCAESAHLIFWFSPNLYCETQAMLSKLDGFKFEEHPLIWIRGENEGIAPDPARRPRRIYETAFFGWRGDRKIIRTKANAFVAPTERERHPHEKSEAALRHWMEMCVDANTRLFDPTCGSGSALRAALALGASSVLGLELNQDYAESARRSLEARGRDPRAGDPAVHLP